jgi:hypothetical protein
MHCTIRTFAPYESFRKQQIFAQSVLRKGSRKLSYPFKTPGEGDWLNVRIDHRPLTCPVAAHFVASVDMTAFHAICPNDILAHGCKHRLHVTSVEVVVNTFKGVHFVRHPSPFVMVNAGANPIFVLDQFVPRNSAKIIPPAWEKTVSLFSKTGFQPRPSA